MIELNYEDLIITGFKSNNNTLMSGADSGVMVLHKPTETVITCNKYKEQRRNEEECLANIRRHVLEWKLSLAVKTFRKEYSCSPEVMLVHPDVLEALNYHPISYGGLMYGSTSLVSGEDIKDNNVIVLHTFYPDHKKVLDMRTLSNE